MRSGPVYIRRDELGAKKSRTITTRPKHPRAARVRLETRVSSEGGDCGKPCDSFLLCISSELGNRYMGAQDMTATAILQPVIVVGLLTVAMSLWMLATRIPAMRKLGIDPQRAWDTSKMGEMLPPEVMRVSNNYNHLFEQPTLFYAVALTIAVLGHTDALHVQCAWAFAGLRIVHSLVQATVDIVMIRFSVFVLSWIALGIMTIREAFMIF